MQTKNTPAPAAPAATPAATVKGIPLQPAQAAPAGSPLVANSGGAGGLVSYRALPRNAISAAAKWQLGKPCFARAVQTQAAYAAVQAAIAAGNNTSAALHTACNTCTPADPTWLGYAIKAGWLVAAK